MDTCNGNCAVNQIELESTTHQKLFTKSTMHLHRRNCNHGNKHGKMEGVDLKSTSVDANENSEVSDLKSFLLTGSFVCLQVFLILQ